MASVKATRRTDAFSRMFGAKRIFSTLCTLTLGLGWAISSPVVAQEVLTGTDCAGVYNPNLSCTSNDIEINDVSQMTEGEGGQPQISTCNEGETGFVDVKLTTLLNANSRYDSLTWMGMEGNDPREATIGNCYVSSFPDIPDSEFILDLEGGTDACLDANSSGNQPVEQYYFQVPFTCTDQWSLDINGDPQMSPDGETDVFALITWFQNNTLNCGTGEGQSMEPGVNPKCDISLLLGLDIQIITNPSIMIVKTPASQQVNPGETANFTLTVTNEGDVDLDTVAVTDDTCDAAPAFQSGDTGSDGVLGLGETWTYTCSVANVQTGFTNTAMVTANDTESAEQVSDDDTAIVTISAPAIQITKTPASQQVNPGGTASFTLTVMNVGDTDLDTVVVTDDMCDAAPTLDSGDTGSDGVLPGDGSETWIYSCSVANVQAGFTNTADVTASPVGGGDQVSDSDTADTTLSAPAIMIVKTPTSQDVTVGTTADFFLTVTNEGDVALENVVVTDAMCDANPVFQSGDFGVDGELGLTETWLYTCSTANVQVAFTNQADVTADPVGGGDSVSDSDTAEVTVSVPPPPTEVIPTLNQWMLIMLAVLLVGAGVLARRGALGRK